MKHGQFSAEDGVATYVLTFPVNPLDDALRNEISDETAGIFKLRQMLVRRPYTLLAPNVTQFRADGGRSIALTAETGLFRFTGMDIDTVVTDVATGRVIRDTRQERIQEHEAFIAKLLPKLGHPVLKAMIDSYCAATQDSDNELVHLYEVRGAVCEHYGNEANARAALTIPKHFWSELRRLANDEPLRQGRHRGEHALVLRDATEDELTQARDIAKRIITEFAATL
jgi:hypothetical protein